ncbi:putative phosphoglycerate mutase GpmB [Streptomyces aurantiacus JA 4570]|uniref:Putative phosphoglycerate mutase GpmB n=1 Tax=Streptomyces aurantiacus JA 4570 TaxID=1286094 RepID=S3ZU44_9ACTN|nr:putative phosphoglycerate mutase GpmB [Streptomyces aurantiacus JA 4570]
MSNRGCRIILWRHGQTAWNLERRFQGTTDIELTDEGLAQARRAARLLASLKPDAIIASDLRRAAATAAGGGPPPRPPSWPPSRAWTSPTTRPCARPTPGPGRA